MCHASCFAGSNAALGEGTVEGARQWSLRMLATCSVWARAATRPAWLTIRLVPSWGQRQHHQILSLEVVPFNGAVRLSDEARCPCDTRSVGGSSTWRRRSQVRAPNKVEFTQILIGSELAAASTTRFFLKGVPFQHVSSSISIATTLALDAARPAPLPRLVHEPSLSAHTPISQLASTLIDHKAKPPLEVGTATLLG